MIRLPANIRTHAAVTGQYQNTWYRYELIIPGHMIPLRANNTRPGHMLPLPTNAWTHMLPLLANAWVHATVTSQCLGTCDRYQPTSGHMLPLPANIRTHDKATSQYQDTWYRCHPIQERQCTLHQWCITVQRCRVPGPVRITYSNMMSDWECITYCK